MLPSISPAQEIGLAVLLVAALVWVLGLGHMLWDSRSPTPSRAPTTACPPSRPSAPPARTPWNRWS